ncbi:hypothetical protein PGT21_028861 [Puccinia graminis f. sp. tritici]|uniref:Uncharacterized protein n=1 Tax=Puccinia graminis f. sp. tritici TaxID=56615 RepID=A0A5B0N7Q2_PUCGR|nr:hypothetical protein PGT21_028861 [Puccinia graminis f. sp. tritici]
MQSSTGWEKRRGGTVSSCFNFQETRTEGKEAWCIHLEAGQPSPAVVVRNPSRAFIHTGQHRTASLEDVRRTSAVPPPVIQSFRASPPRSLNRVPIPHLGTAAQKTPPTAVPIVLLI